MSVLSLSMAWLKIFICFEFTSEIWELIHEERSMKEFRLQQRYILHPSGCVKAQMSLCRRSKVQKLFMRNVCCVWRRMELRSLFIVFYWGSGAVKITRQRRKDTKDWKQGGERGCEPTLSRTFCNQRWEYYPHKSTINLCSGPSGTGPAVTDPPLCSVLQMGGGAVQARAAGVHGGNHAAGWKHKQSIIFH